MKDGRSVGVVIYHSEKIQNIGMSLQHRHGNIIDQHMVNI